MAQSTGPMLAVGAISFGNDWIFNHQVNFKILLATGIGAVILAGAEKVSPPVAVGIAYIALITAVLTAPGGRPSPAQNLLNASKL